MTDSQPPTADWLGSSQFHWPDRVSGPFVVTLRWVSVDGEGRLVGVDLRSVESYDEERARPVTLGDEADGSIVSEPFAPITAEKWAEFGFQRDVEAPLAELLNELTAELLVQWEKEYPAESFEQPRQGRPPTFPDSHYYKVANVVRYARANGRRDVLNAIREAFPDLDVTRDQADHWRKRAESLRKKRGWFKEPDGD